MFKRIIILFVFFLFSFQLKAEVYAYNGTFPTGTKFLTVIVDCDLNPNVCVLLCDNPASWGKVCSWEVGLDNCYDCTTEQVLYNNAQGDEMFDYALEQIEEGTHSGTYTNNIINSPNGTFYRTVEWDYNPMTDECEITININEQ